VRDHCYDRKKRYSRLSGGCAIIITTGKKDTVVCLAGCAVVSVFGSGGKLAVFLKWRERFIMTGEKKIQSSVWRVHDHYYDQKKKIQSSVWRVRNHYYDRKKKIQLSVWRIVLLCQFFGSGGKLAVFLLRRECLLRPEKKRYSRLSGGCTIIITTGKKRYFFVVAGKFCYDRKKKDTVVCLAGALLLLRPEKKDTVVCLVGARSLLQPEKKDTVVCLVGARSLLRPE
jgi:hypothetical protein